MSNVSGRPDVIADATVPRLAYSPAEAAAAIGVTRQFVYNLIARKELRAVKIGANVRIPATELERVLNAGCDAA